MCTSYLSPKTRIQKSDIEGKGLFAKKPINKGEIVAIKGGHIFNEKTLRKVESNIGESYIQIETNFYIGALKKSEVRKNKLFVNHSCEPNLGMRGQVTFIAMRNINTGEELTQDWAMTDAEPYSTQCSCGAKRCRKIITGDDWKNVELQRRYKGYFSPYLQEKINRLT